MIHQIIIVTLCLQYMEISSTYLNAMIYQLGQNNHCDINTDPIRRFSNQLLPRNARLPRTRNDTTPQLHKVRRRMGPRRSHLRPPLRLPPLRRRLPNHPQLTRTPPKVHVTLPPLGQGLIRLQESLHGFSW